MGLISQQLKKQLDRYHTSTERIIRSKDEQIKLLKEQVKYYQSQLN